MNVASRTLPAGHCRALAAAFLLAVSLTASGQDVAPDPVQNTGARHDPEAHHHGTQHRTGPDHAVEESHTDHASMPAVKPSTNPPDHDHHGTNHGSTEDEAAQHAEHIPAPAMTMGRMQGGRAPADARNPDYSDGIDHGDMAGMDMLDAAPLGKLLIDQLEAFHGRDANGQRWGIEGWYGNDLHKLWLRSEGERSHGQLERADIELFWNRSFSAFWNTQVGVRHDFGTGPERTWVGIGLQGLASYWVELEGTLYAGTSGRTAARLRAEYELLLTQRLVLQPELEIDLYGRDDPATRTGSGLSDLRFGLRLRYEVRREFAPYLGVVWSHRFGTTADYAREDGEPTHDRQIVAGIRMWF